MDSVVTTVDTRIEKVYWNGYEIPPVVSKEYGENGQRKMKNPLVDASGEIVMECWELPLNIVKFKGTSRKPIISTRNFTVEILGNDYGFRNVEFPVLDVMSDTNEVALVKLYRCKLEK